MTAIPEYFDHQLQSAEFLDEHDAAFDMSDPGTGKTRGHRKNIFDRQAAGAGKALVFAPKSILQAAWGNDIDKFFPGVRYSIAYASNRKKAFEADADIYITNHDAVKWLIKNMPKDFWDKFDIIVIDESTAFKHRTSKRSSDMRKLIKHFKVRRLLTGTPNSNTICDIWHQTLLLDDGERLGTQFWKFQRSVCTPQQVGPSPRHVKWKDKPGSEVVTFDMISDLTIRHKLEECLDIPPNHQWDRNFDLVPKLWKKYVEMLRYAVTESDEGRVISTVHASALNTKLLQIASGAVYVAADDYVELDDYRAELILDMVEERPASVVVFLWRHQRDQLLRMAKKRGITHFLIDGSVPDKKRFEGVEEFQKGNLQMSLIQPQSAAHGLTLTRGVATIMASPTHNAEHWKQVFHRIYRASQKHKTETIHVRGNNTIDVEVYQDNLGPKLDSMSLFLMLAEQAKEFL